MIDRVENPGSERFSPAKRIGELLTEEMRRNPAFYFFSPDETTSNKFDQIFEVEKRAWGDLPIENWDLPESENGRIIEMLSENVLFSVMTGHLMNGESLRVSTRTAMDTVFRMIDRYRDTDDKNRGIPVEKCLDLL